MSIESPSAIVTGASRGIGLGIATLLASRGWGLTIVARDEERLAGVAGELRTAGSPVVVVVPADLADSEAPSAIVDAHSAGFPDVSALVLIAGVGSAAPLLGYPMRRFDKQFDVNVRAPFALAAAALPLMRAAAIRDSHQGGRVIALSSLEGFHPGNGLSAYAASKAALLSLVRSINLEENGNGIAATAIAPGYVDTVISAWISGRIPPEEMIPVSDVAAVAELVLTMSIRSVIPEVTMHRRGPPYSA